MFEIITSKTTILEREKNVEIEKDEIKICLKVTFLIFKNI